MKKSFFVNKQGVYTNQCNQDAILCAKEAKAALSSVQPTQENKSSYYINFCRAEDAVRGAKAINHLIELHGGKK
jgi:hypothetical protein